jgi:hypothetical protein
VRWSSQKRSGQVTWKPATQRQIRDLLRSDAQAVTATLARLVTADPSLRCTPDGCTASGDSVDLGALTDPSSGPYGAVLERAGVTHGLFLGVIDVASLSDVTLSTAPASGVSDNTSGVRLSVPTVASKRAAAQAAADAGDGPAPPTSGDSGGESTLADSAVAVGFAYGKFFTVTPGWLSADASEGPAPFGTLTAEPLIGFPATPEADAPEVAALPHGLGTASTGAASTAAALSASQLTALSSVTTGCGVGSWCSPTPEGLTVTELSQDTRVLCDAEAGKQVNGTPGTPVRVLVVARSEKWVISEAAVNQFGFWDNNPPDGHLMFWPEPAPVVENATRYVRTLETYQAGPNLLTLSGSVTTTDATWDVDSATSRFPERFQACTDATAPQE